MNLKQEVLKILEAGRGSPLSGEVIAEHLGVSRAAVWKAVASLKGEGHRINAAPHRGYSLDRTSDALTAEGIRAFLSPDSRVRRVICLDTVDSTNTYAKKLALAGKDGPENGTLVAANQQTAGRGRRGHSFVSPPGTGLYMTLLLRPAAELERFQLITTAAAVAVCLTLESLIPSAHPMIKWVNDIFLRGEDGRERKVCGILSEAVSGVESGEIESVVVGIGVNVTTRDFGEEGLNDTAGSVFPESVGRNELAAGIAERLTDLADRLDDPELIRLYRERSLLTGRKVRYSQDGTVRQGHVIDIDDRGSLLIRTPDGNITALRSGEVSEVRPIDSAGQKIRQIKKEKGN